MAELTTPQVINVGTTPGDGTGDTGRDGAIKINDNFSEVYAHDHDSAYVLKAGDTMTGPIIKKTRRITATDTILTTDDVVFCNTATAYTVTLPTGVEGQTLRIINSGTSSNTLTVKPFAGQDLIGIADNSFLLYDGESLEITYNATDGWY